MATSKQITANYIEYIGKEVVDNFGGSYQNFETLGKTWRQTLPYSANLESFVMTKTDLFLRLLDNNEQNNFNMMYNVCYGIAEHLSKYLIKKSPEMTRKKATQQVVNSIFFDSARFIERFKKLYKRPINTENVGYVVSNPGVLAMYRAIQAKQQ